MEAWKWYHLAAREEGNEASVKARERVAGGMSAARIAEGRKRSRAWRPKTPEREAE